MGKIMKKLWNFMLFLVAVIVAIVVLTLGSLKLSSFFGDAYMEEYRSVFVDPNAEKRGFTPWVVSVEQAIKESQSKLEAREAWLILSYPCARSDLYSVNRRMKEVTEDYLSLVRTMAEQFDANPSMRRQWERFLLSKDNNDVLIPPELPANEADPSLSSNLFGQYMGLQSRHQELVKDIADLLKRVELEQTTFTDGMYEAISNLVPRNEKEPPKQDGAVKDPPI